MSNTIELWNNAARNYSIKNDNGNSFYTKIYMNCVDKMLDSVLGKIILDAGCGDGFYTRQLAYKGAAVIGIDGSENLLKIAREKNSHTNVSFQAADLLVKLPFKDNSFDIVVSNMVLMDIEDIGSFISETSRILKPNGVFVFSITHPCFFISDWQIDNNGKRIYKKLYYYLNQRTEELDFYGRTLHFHRPLSYYFNKLNENGFLVSELQEPVPEVKNDDTEYHFRIPSFIVIKAIKK